MALVFALLPSKLQTHYVKVLEKVKEAAARFRIRGDGPVRIMSDFKMAIINVAKHVFLEAVLRLCFFHSRLTARCRTLDCKTSAMTLRTALSRTQST